MAARAPIDWTYSACPACEAIWRECSLLCPRCGALGAERLPARGDGVVAAVTRVMRPASSQFVPPYSICLVDMVEGFRLMGHGAADIDVGAAVIARRREFAGTSIPFFVRSQ